MIFLYAFLVGGGICAIGQFIMDYFKLTPGHLTSLFVVVGAFLDVFDIYDNLVKFSEAGALVPITSFGHSLLHGALDAVEEKGIMGLASGMFDLTSVGIVFAIICAFVFAVLFRPKG